MFNSSIKIDLLTDIFSIPRDTNLYIIRGGGGRSGYRNPFVSPLNGKLKLINKQKLRESKFLRLI